MEKLLESLRQDYPSLKFSEGASFCWSPISGRIFYSVTVKDKEAASFSVLHEVAHALLDHDHYDLDYELLRLEIAAWEHARLVAGRYGIAIADDYVQDCLDSYRTWLYRRSICPGCGTNSAQCDSIDHYQCFNCHTRWSVAGSKFCRPYRHYKGNKKSPATIVAGDL